VSGAGGNPKSENRDPKEAQNPKPEFNALLADQRLNVLVVFDFGFRVSFGSRFSDFGFRRSGRLHFAP
jgi:hypothetical protein